MTYIVCQTLPLATDTVDLNLTTKLSFGANLESYTCDLGREHAELVHHRVDRALELRNLALRDNVDFLRQVALRYSGCHARNRPHLIRQAVAHTIDLACDVSHHRKIGVNCHVRCR